MATNLERLQQTLDNLIAVREQVTRSPKPSYSKDGQSFSWTEYLAELSKQIAAVREEIDDETGDGLVEEHTTAWL